MIEIGREIFWNVPKLLKVLMYVMVAVSVAVAGAGYLRRIKRWFQGEQDGEYLPLAESVRNFITYAVAQLKLFREKYSGIMHLSIFIGFLGLFLATATIVVEEYTPLVFLHGKFYLGFSLLADLAGMLFLAGILLALVRRYLLRPEKLDRRRGDMLILAGLFLMAFSGFLVEAARIGHEWPEYEVYSIGGYLLARGFEPFVPNSASWASLHRFFWIFHLVCVLAFFVFLPHLRLTHILATPVNVLLKKRPLGGLRPVNGLGIKRDIGANTLEQFSWKQLMDLDSCTGCGRCQDVCPAHNTDKPLSPMNVINKLRDILSQGNSPGSSPWQVVEETEMWNCTTCAACEDACPVLINHIDRFVDMRRALVNSGKVKGSAHQALESTFYYGNPWGHSPHDRTLAFQDERVRVLKEDEKTDVLYWIGCAGAYDPQGQEVTTAMMKLLKKAQVDFAIIGNEEKCCGDFARRLGEEGLFLQLARQNIETLKKYRFRRIVTHCPHGYNILKNEYSKIGGNFTVLHHTELIQQLIQEKKISLASIHEKHIAFHDPCYLGRYNDLYDTPREVLREIPETTLGELENIRERAFCCGGGGGHILLDPNYGEGINLKRFEEVERLGVEVVATACPFCKMMFDLAIATRDLTGKVKVKDIAELVEMAS